MGLFTNQCQALSRSTGQRCRQPAVKGYDRCRFHLEKREREAGDEADRSREENRRGAQPGNANALKHGAYSPGLQPEEEEIYRRKRAEFIGQLGAVDVFDAQVVHLLALVSCKLDVAAGQGAPAEALLPIVNEVLKLLRSLKETRDSRDPAEDGAPRTIADFLIELAAIDRERGLSARDEDQRKRIHDLEREVNDLRGRLGLSPRDDIEHRIAPCGHCHGQGEHRKNTHGDLVCLRCGCVTGPSAVREAPAIEQAAG